MPTIGVQCYWHTIGESDEKDEDIPLRPVPLSQAPWGGDDQLKLLMIEASRRLAGRKISPMVPSKEVRDAALKEARRETVVTCSKKREVKSKEAMMAQFGRNAMQSLYIGPRRFEEYAHGTSRRRPGELMGKRTIASVPGLSTTCVINAVMLHMELTPFSKAEVEMAVQGSLQPSQHHSGGSSSQQPATKRKTAKNGTGCEGGDAAVVAPGLSDAALAIPIVRTIQMLVEGRGLVCESLSKEELKKTKFRVVSDMLPERDRVLFLASPNSAGVVAVYSEWMSEAWYLRNVEHIHGKPEDPEIVARYEGSSRGPPPWFYRTAMTARSHRGTIRVLCSIPSPTPWTHRRSSLDIPQRKELIAFIVRRDLRVLPPSIPEVRFASANSIPTESTPRWSDPFSALYHVASESQAKTFLSQTQGESQGVRVVNLPWFEALLHNTARARLAKQAQQHEMQAYGDENPPWRDGSEENTDDDSGY